MATYRRLIRSFSVTKDELPGMTFSDTDKIGIDDIGTSITLRTSLVADRLEFPKDEDGIRFTTPPVGGDLIRFYEFAQFDIVEPDDPNEDPPEVTEVRGRLHDGTFEYFFSGGDWIVITDPITDWNTLDEVSDNLSLYDADLPLGFVFELSTSSAFLTPVVRGVKVLYQIDLPSFHNDWLFAALVDQMKVDIRPFADTIAISDGTTTVDFKTLVEDELETEWTIVGMDAVFNEDSDPAHRADLFLSFDTGSREITLSSAPTSGDRLLIRFIYAPVVAVTTDDDFTELGSTPAVLFEEVDWEDVGEAPTSSNIVNVFSDPPLGVILPAPRRQHVAVTLTVTAQGAVNLRRLAEIVTRFLQERRVITTPTDGREATLRITDIFNPSPLPDQSGLHSATMGFRLENVYVWLREAVETTGVREGGFVILTDVGGTEIVTPVGGT